MRQYEETFVLKEEIEKNLAEYLKETSLLETDILDQFEIVPKTNDIEDLSASTLLSKPIRLKSEELLENILIPLFMLLQKKMTSFASIQCSSKKEKQLLDNICVSLNESQANFLLSQKIAIYQASKKSTN